MTQLDRLALAMMDFDRGSAQRIQHFLKVHHFAALIAAGEAVDSSTRLVLEAAAYTHDIGIRPALEQFGSSAGELQERQGPPLAREMLTALDFAPQVVERVCWLIAHHHTYTAIKATITAFWWRRISWSTSMKTTLRPKRSHPPGKRCLQPARDWRCWMRSFPAEIDQGGKSHAYASKPTGSPGLPYLAADSRSWRKV